MVRKLVFGQICRSINDSCRSDRGCQGYLDIPGGCLIRPSLSPIRLNWIRRGTKFRSNEQQNPYWKTPMNSIVRYALDKLNIKLLSWLQYLLSIQVKRENSRATWGTYHTCLRCTMAHKIFTTHTPLHLPWFHRKYKTFPRTFAGNHNWRIHVNELRLYFNIVQLIVSNRVLPLPNMINLYAHIRTQNNFYCH